jgi:mannose-1-phosphate guanylyltransferase/phosphomannomutase
MDALGRVLGYVEKPKNSAICSNTVNTGIYILDPNLLDDLEPHEAYDFSYDVFPPLLKERRGIYGYLSDNYWRDIGTIQTYRQANIDVLLGRVAGINIGQCNGKKIWLGDNVEIADDVVLEGPIYLGNQVRISPGVVIQGPAVIEDYTVIEQKAWIRHSVIGHSSLIGQSVQLYEAVVSQKSMLNAHSVDLANQIASTPKLPRLRSPYLESRYASMT